MSVLHLRRDMVVAEEPVVEIDRPLPLRTIEGGASPVLDHEDEEDEHEGKSFLDHAKFWLATVAVIGVLAAYPTLTVLSSDVGDNVVASGVDRTQWTAPWAGGAAALLEKHFDDLGWASDAAAWAPMARLSAKPAYQSAMAGAVGEFATLVSAEEEQAGRGDPDLSVVARLVHTGSTGVQLRAARDALVNYDRKERRKGVTPGLNTAALAEQLDLIQSWANKSQAEITAAAASAGSSPLDRTSMVAVYAAKGRAQAAYVFLETMDWPQQAAAVTARTKALAAWKTAAEFHPLVVLAGSPDGSLFGNHAVSMGFLISQAQAATGEYLALARTEAAQPAPAPVAIANSAPPSSVN